MNNVANETEKYLDTSLTAKERAEDLLSKLSLKEKMGQVNCATVFSVEGKTGELMKQFFHQNVTQFDGVGQVGALAFRGMKSLEENVAWQRERQEEVMAASPHHIPAIFHMEGLTGAMNMEATSFPTGLARGCAFDVESEEKMGQVIARQEIAVGATQTLAPVLDITRDSRMGRQGEPYGEDPALSSALGVALTRGIQETEVEGKRTESCAKHFLGFHNSTAGIHGADSPTPQRLLKEIYGRPFQAAIKEANLKAIMPCYCSIDGEPAHASRKILTDLLRTEMGFDGVVISDYGGVSNAHNVQRLYESNADAGYACMKAGMDVEMPNCTGYNSELLQMFADGRADVKVLDRAVLRVLTAKFRMGLFEHPFALPADEARKYMSTGADRALSLKIAKESMVLLKNAGALPIKKSCKKILVVGPHATNARFYFGGYTLVSMTEAMYAAANSMAGVDDDKKCVKEVVDCYPGTQIQKDDTDVFNDVLKLIKPGTPTLLDKIKEKLPDTEVLYAPAYPIAGNDESAFDEALKLAADADLIILTLGGKYGTGSISDMGEGIDGTDINLPVCQDNFIKRVASFHKPLIGIHFGGRPISSDTADEYLDAILEAWAPSEMGAEAVAQIITGEYNPSGHLSVTVARNAGQIPIYYNHANGSSWHQGESIGFVDYVDCPHSPRYFFGTGLSYTSFEYTDLSLGTKCASPYETVPIDLTVRNTGDIYGEDVVQLYVRDIYASATRPVKELAGFARVCLAAGEEQRVHFELPVTQLAFVDNEMHWKVEEGDIEVQIGHSSEEIVLKDTFMIKESAFIDPANRSFYTIGG